MESKNSYLSDPRCQCDFVVATTQASINSGLLEYLDEQTQPIQYMCFLQDDRGYPTMQISLEDLMAKSGGINPFYIPEGTPPGDPRVTALSDAGFGVGVMMQMGIPLGHTPQTLPQIVTLNTASNVTFNLFCRQVTVVSIKWGRKGAIWNVFKQPEGPSMKPWTMKMSVDLTIAGLDEKLNTSYFNNHPKVKDQLLKALDNLSGTAFSLQQLLFDLDNAVLETVPDFSSVDDEDARNILENYFRNMYVKTAKEHGLPLVAVTAVAQPRDESTLHMTAFERIVNPLKDSSGSPITNPTESQQAVTTLDYLCAVNNNPVPRISSLDWNWVQPQDVNDSSGVISINRNILRDFIASTLKKSVSSACYTPIIHESYLELSNGGSPDVTFPSGSNTIHMEYSQSREGPQKFGDSPDLTTKVDTNYTLDVFFEAATIRVVQHSFINFRCHIDYEKGNTDYLVDWQYKFVNKTLTDIYSISVDQTGGLQLLKTKETLDDRSETVPSAPNGPSDVSDTIMGLLKILVSQVIERAANEVNDSSAATLHERQISKLQSFVFPGARVFTYKDPCFSDHQDLVCKITYIDPNEVSPTQVPQDPEQPQQAQTYGADQAPANNPSHPPLQTGTIGKLTACTELMQNYVQGEIISPTSKFEALQTSDGHTLLFAIDTSGVFHVIEEQSGKSHAGWQIHDLSTRCIQTQFPGQEAAAKVHTFDVGQSAVDGTIGLMMAVNLDGNDHLFMSLGNSSDDTSWVSDPIWTIAPFDPAKEQPRKITITGALFAETQDKTQYLIVDIDRPSENMADPHITRYRIDSARKDGHYWVRHDVTVDISAGEYQSVVGRVSGKHVDGIYTAGHTATVAQLIYEPVIDWYGTAAVTPIILQLPGCAIPSAIATTRNTDGSTDLYVISGSTLYRFPADEQEGDIEPKTVFTSDLLDGTDTLRAMTHNGVTTLWGRSMSDQVYYLSCPTERLGEPGAWKAPIPILSGVERMSAYVNRADGGNTIFAFGNDQLQKVVQGSVTTGGTWRPQHITVAAPPEQKSTSFKSYTTSIHVKQLDKDLPAGITLVNVTANTRTPVYINGFYYVISSVPIQIKTDATGCLTIIDTTDSLHAAVLTVSLDNATLTINPMDQTFGKLTSLDSAEKLRGAQFPSQTVAGGVVGSPGFTPLMDSSVSDDDVSAVAQHLDVLKDAYAQMKSPGNGESTAPASICKDRLAVHATVLRNSNTHTTNLFSLGDIFDDIGDTIGGVVHDIGHWIGDTISSLAGDIFHWIKHAAQTVGKIIRDAATGTLHFFAKIGNKIYHAVLDTVHAIVSAAEWVFNKIKAGIKALINFLEMLFQWDDIRRSKDVIHNAIKLWMQHQVDYLPKAKDAFNGQIEEFEDKMNEWAKVSDWSGLGGVSQKTAAQSASDPNKDQTSGSKLLANHYHNHASQLKILGDIPTLNAVGQLISDLMAAISKEGTVLEGVFNQLRQLVNDFAGLSVEQVLQRVAVILTDTVLSSVQVVVDTLLTVLYDVAQSAITILDAKIHIPIISDILNAIGVSDITFLDLICWIAALGFTVVYKLVQQSAPFPRNDDSVQTLISAGTWEELEGIFGQSDFSLMPQLPQAIRESFFKACHGVSGFLCLIGNPVTSIEAASAAGTSGVISNGATIIKVVMGGAQSIGDLLVPQYPVKNSAIRVVSKVASALGILSSVVFSGVAQSAFTAVGFGGLSVGDPRGVGAVAGVVLILPRLVVTGWHFYELTKDGAGDTLTAAILGEVSNLTSYASHISYAVAVNDEDPDTRLIAVTAKAACDDIFAGLQVAETFAGYA
ncbi:hypothetical protein BBP40_000223 [Aspergillus hancockii]|nr:hypothetical protein BBP40_000223 [Aspergillus hancockii]